MKNKKSILAKTGLFAAATSVLLLTGCQSMDAISNGKTNSVDYATLTNYNWKLSAVNSVSEASVAEVTNNKDKAKLLFVEKDGKKSVAFNIGCNDFGASATFNEQTGQLNTGMVRATRQYCEDLQQAEGKLAQLMQEGSALSITNSQSNMLSLEQKTASNVTLVWTGIKRN